MEIYLTIKLSEFIKIDKLDSDQKAEEKWSAHIFILNRKKNIIFTHKETLYSFFVLDITKKELSVLNRRIYNELEIQLESDNVDVKKALKYFNVKDSENIFYLKTDNDQKTLGWTKDLIQVNQSVCEDFHQDKIISSAFFAHNMMNSRLVGKRNYTSPIDMLTEKILSKNKS